MDLNIADQVCTVRNKQPLAIINSVLVKLSQLLEHGGDVNDDTVSEHVHTLRV